MPRTLLAFIGAVVRQALQAAPFRLRAVLWASQKHQLKRDRLTAGGAKSLLDLSNRWLKENEVLETVAKPHKNPKISTFAGTSPFFCFSSHPKHWQTPSVFTPSDSSSFRLGSCFGSCFGSSRGLRRLRLLRITRPAEEPFGGPSRLAQGKRYLLVVRIMLCLRITGEKT